MVVVEAASETVEYEYAIPRADATIQSYRAIGYDLPTAIADIIDNSLSAGAVNVWLMFEWDGDNSWITVRDDGCGMDEVELVNAMRPGSCSPLDERSERDLGRFGLGLKTAAFSQAKRLIVRSRRTDDAAVYPLLGPGLCNRQPGMAAASADPTRNGTTPWCFHRSGTWNDSPPRTA